MEEATLTERHVGQFVRGAEHVIGVDEVRLIVWTTLVEVCAACCEESRASCLAHHVFAGEHVSLCCLHRLLSVATVLH